MLNSLRFFKEKVLYILIYIEVKSSMKLVIQYRIAEGVLGNRLKKNEKYEDQIIIILIYHPKRH